MRVLEDRVPVGESEVPVITLMPSDGAFCRNQRLLIVYGGSTQEHQRDKIASFWGPTLTDRGFLVHVFEFRSNLDAARFHEFGLYDRLVDLRMVYQWLIGSRSGGDAGSFYHLPLSVMGVSMGGYLAARAASEFARRMHAVVLVAPAAYHDQACRPDVKFGSAFTRAIRVPEFGWRGSAVFKDIRSANADCLIVAYENDEIVPREIPQAYAENMHAKIREIADGQGFKAGTSPLLRYEILPGFKHRGTFDNSFKRRRLGRLLSAFFDQI